MGKKCELDNLALEIGKWHHQNVPSSYIYQLETSAESYGLRQSLQSLPKVSIDWLS